MSWVVESTRAISPPQGSDCDATYLIRLTQGEATAETVVGFVAPSSVPSGGYAEEALSRYLRDDLPPHRIAVELDGSVRVVSTEWRAPSPPPRDTRLPSANGVRRARRHTRG